MFKEEDDGFDGMSCWWRFADGLPFGLAPCPGCCGAWRRSAPSGYDSKPTSQAFSGPYEIKSYSPGRQIILVRNPNWNRQLDGVRPAYADKIVWNAGADPTVAAQQTLDSPNLLMADGPPAAKLKVAYQTKKTQLSIAPLGIYDAALDHRHHRSTTSTCARPWSPMRTGRRTSGSAAVSWSDRWPRTTSIPECRATRRPADPVDRWRSQCSQQVHSSFLMS